MTILRQNRSERVQIPAGSHEEFWSTLTAHYAGHDPQQWKELAMLVLSVQAGWTNERIAYAFEQTPGHVSRTLQTVKRALRSRFAPAMSELPAGVLDDA